MYPSPVHINLSNPLGSSRFGSRTTLYKSKTLVAKFFGMSVQDLLDLLFDGQRPLTQLTGLRRLCFTAPPAGLHQEIENGGTLGGFGAAARLDLGKQLTGARLGIGILAALDELTQWLERIGFRFCGR